MALDFRVLSQVKVDPKFCDNWMLQNSNSSRFLPFSLCIFVLDKHQRSATEILLPLTPLMTKIKVITDRMTKVILEPRARFLPSTREDAKVEFPTTI